MVELGVSYEIHANNHNNKPTMKNKKKGIIAVSIVAVLGLSTYYFGCSVGEVTNHDVIGNSNTALYVVNASNDTVTAYLTMGSIGDTNYVQNTIGIFGIADSGVQNTFQINPNDTLAYQSPMYKGFNGNITFGGAPMNCPDTTIYPNGINLFEFNLNDPFAPNSQETTDISCVSGVNCLMTVTNINGGGWNNGTDTIASYKNAGLYDNDGLSGVFPFGCDSCTSITSRTPYCAGHKPYAKPQATNICNIQRNATNNGGVVILQFNGLIK